MIEPAATRWPRVSLHWSTASEDCQDSKFLPFLSLAPSQPFFVHLHPMRESLHFPYFSFWSSSSSVYSHLTSPSQLVDHPYQVDQQLKAGIESRILWHNWYLAVHSPTSLHYVITNRLPRTPLFAFLTSSTRSRPQVSSTCHEEHRFSTIDFFSLISDKISLLETVTWIFCEFIFVTIFMFWKKTH